MLQQYADSQAGVPAEMRATLTAGDTKAAERLAHTLKGVSATLGIKAASAAAAVVDVRLRHGGPEGIEGDLVALEQVVEVVIAAIRTALAPVATVTGENSVDHGAVMRLLGRLEGLLIASDGAALDCVLETQEPLAHALSAEEYAGLTQAVQNFDFEMALTCLHAITARLEFGTSDGVTGGLGEFLARLGNLLTNADGEALEATLAAQEVLERAFGAREADALLRDVGNFDFDAALIRVRGLSARLAAASTGE
jgi:HPt (histidine-containing phosphotransfer) domain-containing protein